MHTLDAEPSVTVLLDPGTHECLNPDSFDIDVRLDAYRRTVVEENIETCRAEGNDEQAREWFHRTRDVVADAPDPTTAQHRDWVERHFADLEGG